MFLAMYTLLVILLFGGLPSFATVAPLAKEQIPIFIPDGPTTTLTNNSYIIMFKDGHNLEDHYKTIGFDVSKKADTFHPLPFINGYRAVIKDDFLVNEKIRRDAGVHLIEQSSSHNIGRKEQKKNVNTKKPAASESKHKSRFKKHWEDWEPRPRDDFNWWLVTGAKEGTNVRTWKNGGQGVDVYVFDGGVSANQEVGTDRLSWLGAQTPSHCSPYCPGHHEDEYGVGHYSHSCSPFFKADDDEGHGTQIASIIAGEHIGVAPAASIVSVKVICDDDVNTSKLTQAFQDVIDREMDRAKVKNMSFMSIHRQC